MVRLCCYLGLIVADVSIQTASGPCNRSRSIKCMPLGVTVAQGWNVSLRWNPAGCIEFFPFCNYFEVRVILRDGHTTIPKAISSKPPDCERSSFWTSPPVRKRQEDSCCNSPDVHVGGVLMSCRLERLSLWLPGQSRSLHMTVAANAGFVLAETLIETLFPIPSANYRSRAPTHELSKNWGEKVGPLLGLII